MKEFKHSCTRALHLTSCDFPARGPSVSHPKPLPAPGDPAGGGNVRAGAGAQGEQPPADAVLPSRGGGRNAAVQTEAGPSSVRAKTDLAGRTVKSTTHVRCHLRPTQTLSALLLITTRDQGGLQSLPGPPQEHPPGHCPPGRTPRALLLSLRTQEPDTGTGRTGPWIFCGGSPSGACSTPRKAPVWAHEAPPFAPEA